MSAVAAGLLGAVGLSVAGEPAPATPPSTAAPASANVVHVVPDQSLEVGGAVRARAAGAAGAAAAMAPMAVSTRADAAEMPLDKLSGRESELTEEEAQDALNTSVRDAVAKPAAAPAPPKAPVVPTIAALAERASQQPSKSNSQAYARMAVSANGWGNADYACLVKLWTKESQWNHKAMNRSSGAYGIPQSLPGSKMASAGKSWRTDPPTQIRWGLSYIKSRYGTPCGAWRHSQATNWY